MQKKELVKRSHELMEHYGFSYASLESVRASFDIIAERKGKLLILKIVKNIDSLTANEARCLSSIGNFFDADTFVVAIKRKALSMSRGISFSRHDLKCVDENTLEDFLNSMPIHSAEKFFKKRQRVDSEKLRKLRELSGLSLRKLSEMVSISKESINRYERYDSYITQENLNKLESFFVEKLSKDDAEIKSETAKMGKGFMNLGINVVIKDAPPFSFLAKKDFRYEIGKNEDMRTLKKLAAVYNRISSVLTEDHQFIMTNKKQETSIDGVPIINAKELSNIHEEKELLELIYERKT